MVKPYNILLTFGLLLIIPACSRETVTQKGGQDGVLLDRAALEALEERTEAFANRLLDLSVVVRKGGGERMITFFADQLEATPFPHEPEPVTLQPGGFATREWVIQKQPNTMSRNDFLLSAQNFLAHYSHIEDARFKVKQSTIENDVISSRVFFFLIGRDPEERMEWTRGWLQVKAHASEELNQAIFSFEVESLSSELAQQDLFSEVSLSAGVAHFIQAYGQKGNDSTFWHGAAAADIDLDGRQDIYVTGISNNKMYLNRGNGTFEDVAPDTFTATLPPSTGPLFFDMDNDGDQDLFLAAPDAQILLENLLIPDGRLEFRDVSLESGIGLAKALGFSAVAGDVNGDGLQDIYVASYNRYGIVMPDSWHAASNGTPNLLFINEGNGRFREAAREMGVADRRWSYAAHFIDFDDDGDQDLYVANDYGLNGLYINDGDAFTDKAVEFGLQDPGNGMGVSFGDYDNDGDLDLHVTNMSSTAGNRILKRLFKEVPQKDLLVKLAAGNSLYENLGDGDYKNVTTDVGGFSAGWAWGGGFIDYNNDGWEDLFSPNGFISGKSMKDT